MKPPTTPSLTQRRLMALLVAAIYGIAHALLPVIKAIESQSPRPGLDRTDLAGRFCSILAELLSLTARIRPGIFSRTPSFPNEAASPRTSAAANRNAGKDEAAATGPLRALNQAPTQSSAIPATMLTARQLAKRLAHLLHRLHCLIIEAGARLPTIVRRHAIRASTIAGCHALPNAPTSWERAG